MYRYYGNGLEWKLWFSLDYYNESWAGAVVTGVYTGVLLLSPFLNQRSELLAKPLQPNLQRLLGLVSMDTTVITFGKQESMLPLRSLLVKSHIMLGMIGIQPILRL